ncbi:MAG: hypothetical protein RLZZ367_2175 [Bacteroidota bacterium]
MKRLHFYLLLLVCMALVLPVSAANTLRVEIIPQGTDSFSVIKNGSVSFTLRLHNDSLTNYAETLGFNYSIDSAGVGSPVTYTDTNSLSGLSFPVAYDTIPGRDSTDITITVNASEPRFKTGPSVVVIWPIRTDGTISGNVTTFKVVVLDPAGINEQDDKKLQAFLWNKNLMIQRQSGIQIKQLRVFDILGRELENKLNPTDNTALPLESHGVYIAEITYNSNQRKVFKFYY